MLEGLLAAKKLDKSGAQELSLNITCPLKWISLCFFGGLKIRGLTVDNKWYFFDLMFCSAIMA